MTNDDRIEWPRRCRCGESWSAEEWADLPSDGRYFAGRDGWMELRMCVCGLRLSLPCDPPASSPPTAPSSSAP